MNEAQFKAVAKLLHGQPSSKSYQAALSVIVHKMKAKDATLKYGISKSTVSDAVARYRKADALIKKTYLSISES